MFGGLVLTFTLAGFLFGNGVVSSRTERIAAENAPYRQPEAHKKASFLKCLDGIG